MRVAFRVFFLHVMLILTATGGLGFVNENFSEGIEDDSYTALREGARVLVFVVGRGVEAFHNHDTYLGVTGEDNLFFRMQHGVRLKLVAGLVSTIQTDLDYDRTPAPGRKNTDRTFSLTFGYRF